ncbi:glycosyltransferase, partial [Thermodesulfobacteriota bacterium]
GPERNNIESQIKALGLNNDVIITGFQEDVRPFISLCDCMVITSHSETFSIAALEAMAMEKPMIMTNVGGATEQIDHGKNGFIYAPGDVNALADYMSQLFATALRKKFGRSALHTVKSEFSLDKMINKYENLLCKIVNS